VNEFFQGRSVWYARLHPFLLPLFIIIAVLSLFGTVYLLSKKQYVLSGFAILTIVTLSIASARLVTGKLFPQSEIRLSDKASLLNSQTLLVIFAAIGALATLVGVLLDWTRQVKP